MCWDAPPPAYRGPGDAHSNLEWIWRRPIMRPSFAMLPRARYDWKAHLSISMPGARRRIAEELTEAKLIIIVRDPIDRAYSNGCTSG